MSSPNSSGAYSGVCSIFKILETQLNTPIFISQSEAPSFRKQSPFCKHVLYFRRRSSHRKFSRSDFTLPLMYVAFVYFILTRHQFYNGYQLTRFAQQTVPKPQRGLQDGKMRPRKKKLKVAQICKFARLFSSQMIFMNIVTQG